jgi:single-strand DNA-binding protein
MNYQSITIVGKVGKDSEMRYTPNGQAITSFSVATNRRYNQNGESVNETTWFRVTTWGKLAENCNQYVKKGMDILVEGRLTPDKETGGPRIWDSNGTPKASFEVSAQTVQFGAHATRENETSDPDTNDGSIF